MAVLAVAVALLLAGCTGGGGETGQNFQISISSPDTGVDALNLDIRGVEVIRDTSSGSKVNKVPISDSDIDLSGLQGEKVLGTANLPAGEYNRVKMKVSVAEAMNNGEEIEVLVPDSTVETGGTFRAGDGQINYLMELKVLRVGPTAAYTLVPVKEDSGVK